ncbi:uncharacterized protein ZBIST_4588 [Zygosaccharomyces bailii]|uniref:ZYBA0S04-06414g1_1 n=1 Tax=Zygosaccharomyces bailii (strain CLIB 213 / ATCC 58445 / CBS 680 / BCRC 21525 / NBRC 1098 / NCYC 1416 / NRRL Y-2227) TaxID=1333698 RepID=A0A8J2T7G1_ZYGB2|nr:ZYBA0S04-06414g1_1 [Zygosaccharomyces bailii CLIB 213]CDH08494.1 uncharacterized protein ZBAI_00276 [Zygosaccharomyces bailii ISA1307]SJM88399.1 uncharacterized protein ZBIST_4588 [Zygosaccharomyces bailii]
MKSARFKTSKKQSKKYTLSIEEAKDGMFVKFTMMPSSYMARSMINFTILIMVNLLSINMVKTHSNMSTLRQLALHFLIFAFSIVFFRKPAIETLTVVRNYGVELTEVQGFVICPNAWVRPWLEKTDFIPRDLIVDIIINEGFVKNGQVIFYLAVLIREAKKLTLLFPVCSNSHQKHIGTLLTRIR